MPGGKGNIKSSDGRPFSSTNQPANRGRKVKTFSQIARDWQGRGIERATPEVVIEAFEFLLALPLSELKTIAKDGIDIQSDETGEVPSIIQMAAEEMTGKRKREILGEMLDRAHGKATQKQEHSTKNGSLIEVGIKLEALTLDEKVQLFELAQKIRANE